MKMGEVVIPTIVSLELVVALLWAGLELEADHQEQGRLI
jgi:hypothetical protein